MTFFGSVVRSDLSIKLNNMCVPDFRWVKQYVRGGSEDLCMEQERVYNEMHVHAFGAF